MVPASVDTFPICCLAYYGFKKIGCCISKIIMLPLYCVDYLKCLKNDWWIKWKQVKFMEIFLSILKWSIIGLVILPIFLLQQKVLYRDDKQMNWKAVIIVYIIVVAIFVLNDIYDFIGRLWLTITHKFTYMN